MISQGKSCFADKSSVWSYFNRIDWKWTKIIILVDGELAKKYNQEMWKNQQ